MFGQPGDTEFPGAIPSFELGDPPRLRDRRLQEKKPEQLQGR
jgi:hypothetical protein